MAIARKTDPKSCGEDSLCSGSIIVLSLMCSCPLPAPGTAWADLHVQCQAQVRAGDQRDETLGKLDRVLHSRLGWGTKAMACNLTYYGSVQRAGNVIPRERYLSSGISGGSEFFRLRIRAASFRHLGTKGKSLLDRIPDL